jgi:hypothetical protein
MIIFKIISLLYIQHSDYGNKCQILTHMARSSSRFLAVYMDRPVKPVLLTLVKLILKLRQTSSLCEEPAIVLLLLVPIEPVADIAVLSLSTVITLNIKLNCPPRIHRMDILKVSQARSPPAAFSTPGLHVKVVLRPLLLILTMQRELPHFSVRQAAALVKVRLFVPVLGSLMVYPCLLLVPGTSWFPG